MRAITSLAVGHGIVILLSAYGPAYGQEPAAAPEDRSAATQCLALAVAYEAGYESMEGQQAVAQVVLNRLHDPAYPKTVCGVVFDGSYRRTGCQFTFTCDGSLHRRRLPASVLQAAHVVAEDAMAGRLPSRVPGATHYHADYVRPYWAPSLTRIAKIGAHIFYQAGGTSAAAASISDQSTARSTAMAPPTPGFAPWGLALPPTAPAGR